MYIHMCIYIYIYIYTHFSSDSANPLPFQVSPMTVCSP